MLLRILGVSFLLIATACAAGARWVYSTERADAQAEIRKEGVKALLQVGVVGFLGAAATLTVDEFRRQRDRHIARKELRREYLADLIEAYNEVKRVRRELRAQLSIQSKESPPPIEFKKSVPPTDAWYHGLMGRLIGAQLKLEALRRHAEHLFPKERDRALRWCLGRMESYVSKALAEYEDGRRGEHLDDFVRRGPSRFKTEFANRHHRAARLVIERISGVRAHLVMVDPTRIREAREGATVSSEKAAERARFSGGTAEWESLESGVPRMVSADLAEDIAYAVGATPGDLAPSSSVST